MTAVVAWRWCLGGRWIPTDDGDDSFSKVANSAGLRLPAFLLLLPLLFFIRNTAVYQLN